MCLGIPGQVVAVADGERGLGVVDVGGVRREVNLQCVIPDGGTIEDCVGEWVLLHVGFAMNRISAEEAQRTLELLGELGEIVEGGAEPAAGETRAS